ncbi:MULTISPECIES: DUF2804 domain-containing protein [unclassified Oleiphilus]|uniref:DUF2804 domain-containing protein n=2 Tax=Oleiphilus TaxID=141450 RepID=UPI0007C30984|nr:MULTISPECIES: DUF2804 domain-containing protein [unclassified Oleiphilus]KZY65664.1 hypothetical protein A3735_07865 [Oleiphilus sp. HI0061]KZZ36572.1 hypothetical protein A3757_13515 [Oleiphilus sp. HI0117]KZZ39152.1 hypothetical protein A3756_08955 [Oleiphilus sp. HI0086]KZZ57462.1 hypothetical protein A3761_00040 [Oleiphilus sp. HI0123]KZZ74853.1 hypothetical protein A3766_04005 [Oleiphilus sp. HI0132]
MLQPYSLINSHGKPHLGRFKHAVNEININDADYRTPMNKRANKWQRHFNFKRFQYFGGISGDLIFGCALADLRYLGAAFVYIYRTSDKKMLTWQFKKPFALGLDMTNRPDNGISSFKSGKHSIKMRYQLNSQGERRKILEIGFGSELNIQAETIEKPSFEEMALCTPTAVNGWVYAQKTAALPASGEVHCALGKFKLNEIACYGHHDFSAGYMRRETFWNWACFSGASYSTADRSEDKPPLGLNVSWGVNETGYSENCFWVGDKLHQLPQVQFRYDRDEESSAWRISCENGQLDLSFVPEGMHKEHLNAGFMATNFKQIFGKFKGHLITAEGKRYEIESQYGFVEDQYSKW